MAYNARLIHVFAIGGDSTDLTRQLSCIPTAKVQLTSSPITSSVEYKDSVYTDLAVTQKKDTYVTGSCASGVFTPDSGSSGGGGTEPGTGGTSTGGGGKNPPPGLPD
jgi:hypothetical protein